MAMLNPGHIGKLQVKNRIVMLPMATEYASPEGYVTKTDKIYYAERAQGGAGLIRVAAVCVDPRGRRRSRQLQIWDDKFVAELAGLADAIKSNGARAFIQLHHAGMASPSSVTGSSPVGPSALTMPECEPAKELTSEAVKALVGRFAQAASRAKAAGFDGIEIQSAHRYLLAEFLSSVWNQRCDEYGGSLVNRARFLTQTIRAIRKAVGADLPILCRLNAAEYGLKGSSLTMEEALAIAKLAVEVGVDAIDVTCCGWMHGLCDRTSYMPQTSRALLSLAQAFKKALDVPVIATGRLDARMGEVALHKGEADFIGIGRALVADPYLPVKVAEGRLDDITPCICCYECLVRGRGMICSTNAAVGREKEYRIRPARKTKQVIVVGGGVAGMEAARVATLRGHRVTLLERESRLGGQLRLSVIPPHKEPIQDLIDYLTAQMKKLSVSVELGKKATPRLIEERKPSVVVLATGLTTVTLGIRGINGGSVVTAAAALTGKAEVGDKVIVVGGGLVGCETAEFLAHKGKQVTIVEIAKMIAEKLVSARREPLMHRLSERMVSMLTAVKCTEVVRGGLVITNEKGETETLQADTIVIAAGAQSDTQLFHALEGKVPELYRIGDCAQPRNICSAIADGYRIGLTL